MGMAHRGRLSVIAEFLRKPFKLMFAEFSENYIPNTAAGDGDVKYHLGYVTTRKPKTGGEVEVRLSANPSHLEAVNPVVQGHGARAAAHPQGHRRAEEGDRGAHPRRRGVRRPGHRGGDAEHVAAPGLSHRRHDPHHRQQPDRLHHPARGRALDDVLHRRGEDDRGADLPRERRRPAGGALRARNWRSSFARQFKRDVVIDIYCYRRHGHNEADDPVSTQPTMYADISHAPERRHAVSNERLVANGIISQEEADALDKEMDERHEKALAVVKAAEKDQSINSFTGSTAVPQPPYTHDPVETGGAEGATGARSSAR